MNRCIQIWLGFKNCSISISNCFCVINMVGRISLFELHELSGYGYCCCGKWLSGFWLCMHCGSVVWVSLHCLFCFCLEGSILKLILSTILCRLLGFSCVPYFCKQVWCCWILSHLFSAFSPSYVYINHCMFNFNFSSFFYSTVLMFLGGRLAYPSPILK